MVMKIQRFRVWVVEVVELLTQRFREVSPGLGFQGFRVSG